MPVDPEEQDKKRLAQEKARQKRNDKLRAKEQAIQDRKDEKARFMAIPLNYHDLEREALARANYMTKMSTAYNAEMMELARLARNRAAGMRRALNRDKVLLSQMNDLKIAGRLEEEESYRPDRTENLKRLVWDGYVAGMHYMDFKEKEGRITGRHG